MLKYDRCSRWFQKFCQCNGYCNGIICNVIAIGNIIVIDICNVIFTGIANGIVIGIVSDIVIDIIIDIVIGINNGIGNDIVINRGTNHS